ncbi:MAG: class II glutamine amidotransferase [Clostridiales Family XIII bacterium]|jgi:glutamine amidotransferase|nr:class II glutamine amidotransferase [Clostridiales Family XIII bacterium]
MCQLFAVSADHKININDELASFISRSDVHKHGWGYIDFTGHHVAGKRETIPAFASPFLREKLASPFEVSHALFHIRYATVGAVDIRNTHPLTALDIDGRQWAIIHNGTIFNGDKLNRFFHSQTGDTDTERLLLGLMERINSRIKDSRVPLTDAERFKLVNKTLTEAAAGNKLNVIISDSDLLYVHGNSPHGSRLLGSAAADDYIYTLGPSADQTADQPADQTEGTAAAAGIKHASLFSTVPLDDRDWQPVKINTVFAYKDGRVIFEGPQHDHEYIETEADIHDLYQGFASL